MTMYEQSQQSDWLQTELESMSLQEASPAKTSQSQETKQVIADGTRSGLWSECARLLGELRPQYAIFENVTNLLNGERGDWFKRVLWDISALGYDAEWHCIPASELGAHHHRDRIWIIAYPNDNGSSSTEESRGVTSRGDNSEAGQERPANLRDCVQPESMRMWPTPTAHNAKEGAFPSEYSKENANIIGASGWKR